VTVAKIPALDPNHALRLYYNIVPEGYPGELHCDNYYSIVMDVYKARQYSSNIFSLFQQVIIMLMMQIYFYIIMVSNFRAIPWKYCR
jgi:hypothetical protein